MTEADRIRYESWRTRVAQGGSVAGIGSLGLLESLLRAADDGAISRPAAPERTAPSISGTVFVHGVAYAIRSHLATASEKGHSP